MLPHLNVGNQNINTPSPSCKCQHMHYHFLFPFSRNIGNNFGYPTTPSRTLHSCFTILSISVTECTPSGSPELPIITSHTIKNLLTWNGQMVSPIHSKLANNPLESPLSHGAFSVGCSIGCSSTACSLFKMPYALFGYTSIPSWSTSVGIVISSVTSEFPLVSGSCLCG